jgi:hypothetical protein
LLISRAISRPSLIQGECLHSAPLLAPRKKVSCIWSEPSAAAASNISAWSFVAMSQVASRDCVASTINAVAGINVMSPRNKATGLQKSKPTPRRPRDSTFKQSDVSRAIRAARAAGIDAIVEIDKSGTIRIVGRAVAMPCKPADSTA